MLDSYSTCEVAIVIPRSFSSGALSIPSNATAEPPHTSEQTRVNAAVSVVLPWSTCPIVPTLTWGFERSNASFAMATHSPESLSWCFDESRSQRESAPTSHHLPVKRPLRHTE